MTEPTIDVQVIQSFQEMGTMIGKENYYQSVFQTFEKSFEKDLTELQEKMVLGEFSRVKLLAHRMKSSARTIGAMRLGACLASIEAGIDDRGEFQGEKRDDKAQKAELDQLYAMARKELQPYLISN